MLHRLTDSFRGLRFWRVAVLAAATLGSGGLVRAANDGLAEIQDLAQGGATTLALRMLDQLQPPAEKNPTAWMSWERERVAIYQQSKEWDGLVRHLASLPVGLPSDFVDWAQTQQAEALLAMGRGADAREVLMRLVWAARDPQPAALMQWRRLIVRSYLAQGDVTDAHTAIVRYQQDYGSNDLRDVLLRARTLLLLKRPADAAALLAKHADNPEAGMLYLLAQLRSNIRPAKTVLQAALRQMRGDWVQPELQSHLWAVAAEAAQRCNDMATRASALEHTLVEAATVPLPPGLFDIDADTLWDAYVDYALQVGNRSHFLIGDDDKWFQAAQVDAKRYPVKARSLYALLITRSQRAATRDRAAQAFLDTLKEHKQAGVLLRQLFLDSRQFPSLNDVPLAVRHVLVDVALADSDIPLASRLMATMREAPAGADPYMWQLRRARILIMGERAQDGAAALKALLQGPQVLDKDQIDRLLQVVFDLQTVGDNEPAIGLFELAFARSSDPQQRREILYWMADSRKAEQRYSDAAVLYLRSATLQDPAAMDPWAQTARYQAADALAKAGMVKDARVLYERLLAVTQDPARRAVLNHDLQRLWLLR